ncbi:PucR family transcriptional regulator ligand-binding domain-containing protein, partial [Streptomyces sp. NPDC020125]
MEPQEPHKPQESREPHAPRVSGEPHEPRVPGEPHGTITVARALGLPALRRGLPDVVSGEELLDRPVRWVHAGEVPNIAALLKGGELLLTTGIGVGSRPAEQRAFVRRLAERGIAALVVELGPRFRTLPGPVV